jgi:hypothetical protein
MPVDLDKEAQKAAIKEAITEWLNVQAAKFGWFSLKVIMSAALAGLLYAYLVTRGFKL